MGFLDIMGLRYNPGITYVNIFNDGKFNNSMWVLPKFVLVYGFIIPCMYCILSFCSMMNVYGIINYLGARIVLLPSIMGRVPKSHSIHVQNPIKSPFSNKDLMWTFEIHHGGQNKMTIQFAYVPYVRISKCLEGEQRDTNTPMESNVYKNFPIQTDVKQPTIKNHLGHTW
jgi:hypothetical protein